MNQQPLEQYVSPEEAAAFLKVNRLKVIRMARCGVLPAHPLTTGKRKQWRFKLSELDKYMQSDIKTNHPPVRQ
jgi:excisionase family DNA binding protein